MAIRRIIETTIFRHCVIIVILLRHIYLMNITVPPLKEDDMADKEKKKGKKVTPKRKPEPDEYSEV